MVDIFSFWDYPVGMGYILSLMCLLSSAIFIFMVGMTNFWYSSVNISSMLGAVSKKFSAEVNQSQVQSISGTNGVVVGLFFFTFIYVFGIFSPWCYPLGVHTVMITGVSLSMWITGILCNMLGEDIIYVGHFCLPSESLGLSGVMSDVELISKFLQWITVSLRLSLNMIVGTFMITGVFNFVGVSESIFCFTFLSGMSVISYMKIFYYLGFWFVCFFMWISYYIFTSFFYMYFYGNFI
uniref:ATP synthase Fo subunit 6 n=1 Tax=Conchocele cf. bisecta HPD1644 TaxID=1872713 RepID=A0A1B4WRJ5_9BIVA|nr:ATP synthase Fo subunit 6 [Conchocele cf. bisecta HPD1644]